MKMTYRRLTADDSKAYRAIRLESLKAFPESFGSSYEEQSQLPKLMFEKALEQPSDERFLIGAFDQNELVGICGFIPFTFDEFSDLSKAGTIIQMYVRTAYSRRKIGLHLINATIDEAFKLPGIDQIALGVRAGNLSAIRVYEQAGFQIHKPATDQVDFRIMVLQRPS